MSQLEREIARDPGAVDRGRPRQSRAGGTVPAAAMMLVAGFYAALPTLACRRGHDPNLPPPSLRKVTGPFDRIARSIC